MTAHHHRAEAIQRGARMLRTALGPALAQYLEDPAVVEIMLNPDGRIWMDRLSQGLAIGYARNLHGRNRFVDQGQATADGNCGQQIIPANVLRLDMRMMSKLVETLHKVIVKLGSRRSLTDDEGLTGYLGPIHDFFAGQRMGIGERHEDALRPKMGGFAVRPVSCAGEEMRCRAGAAGPLPCSDGAPSTKSMHTFGCL
jgi:hypothetical protein